MNKTTITTSAQPKQAFQAETDFQNFPEFRPKMKMKLSQQKILS